MADDERGTLTTGGGSLLTVQHTERHVKTYLVLEPEMQSLSMLNAGSVLFFSLGGACFGYGLDWFRDWANAKAAASPPNADFIVAWAAAAVCFLIGAGFLWFRRSTIKRIEVESVQRGAQL